MRAKYHWDKKVIDVAEFISAESKEHGWFEGKMNKVTYKDSRGRNWIRCWGILKKDVRLTTVKTHKGVKHYPDTLGGMMWDVNPETLHAMTSWRAD